MRVLAPATLSALPVQAVKRHEGLDTLDTCQALNQRWSLYRNEGFLVNVPNPAISSLTRYTCKQLRAGYQDVG